MKQNLKLMSSRYGQDNDFILIRRLCLVSSHSAMSGFSVFTGAVHLLASLPFLHRPPHPERPTPWALCRCHIQFQNNIMLGCRGTPLFGQIQAQTTSTKTPVLASPTQAETASEVCPTNLRISAGSSQPYEVNQVTIFSRPQGGDLTNSITKKTHKDLAAVAPYLT